MISVNYLALPFLLVLCCWTFVGQIVADEQQTIVGNIEIDFGTISNDQRKSEQILGISSKYLAGLVEKDIELAERNVSLHFVTNAEPKPDAKQVLVFLHGFPQNWYTWRHQLQYFQRENIVYAFDLRGFGQSTKPAETIKYALDEHVADLEDILTRLRQAHPNAQINLITHDIGAAIGASFMYEQYALVDRFVQINAPNPKSIPAMVKNMTLPVFKLLTTAYFYKVLGFLLPGGERTLSAKFLEKTFLGADGVVNQSAETFDESDLAVYEKAVERKEDARAAINFYRAAILAKPLSALLTNMKEFLLSIFMANSKEADKGADKHLLVDKIPKKTLVVWGLKDTVFGVEFAEAALAQCVDGKLIKLANTSHWVPEDAPQELNMHIDAFIRDQN